MTVIHLIIMHHEQCYFSNVYEYGNENGYYSFYENENVSIEN